MKNENDSSSINNNKKNKESSPKKQLNYSFTKEFINIISLNEEDEDGSQTGNSSSNLAKSHFGLGDFSKMQEDILGEYNEVSSTVLDEKIQRKICSKGKEMRKIKTFVNHNDIDAKDIENNNNINENDNFLKIREINEISNEEFYKMKYDLLNDDYLEQLKNFIIDFQYSVNSPNSTISIGSLFPLEKLVESGFNNDNDFIDEMLKKYNLFEEYIFNYRTIKGDGNCYYRAVMFRYIEILILNKKISLLQNIIFDMKNSFYSQEILSRKEIKMNTVFKPELPLKIMIIILDLVIKNKAELAHLIFLKSLLICPIFDFGLIFYFRYIFYTYIKENENKLYLKNFPIKIGNLLPSKYETEDDKFLFDSFYQNYLLKMFMEAEKIIIYLTPFILGINLDIIIFNDESDIIKKINYDGKPKYLIEDRIFLMNLKNHYELLYTKHNNEKYESLFSKYINNDYLKNSAILHELSKKNNIIIKPKENINKHVNKNSNKNIPNVKINTNNDININTNNNINNNIINNIIINNSNIPSNKDEDNKNKIIPAISKPSAKKKKKIKKYKLENYNTIEINSKDNSNTNINKEEKLRKRKNTTEMKNQNIKCFQSMKGFCNRNKTNINDIIKNDEDTKKEISMVLSEKKSTNDEESRNENTTSFRSIEINSQKNNNNDNTFDKIRTNSLLIEQNPLLIVENNSINNSINNEINMNGTIKSKTTKRKKKVNENININNNTIDNNINNSNIILNEKSGINLKSAENKKKLKTINTTINLTKHIEKKIILIKTHCSNCSQPFKIKKSEKVSNLCFECAKMEIIDKMSDKYIKYLDNNFNNEYKNEEIFENFNNLLKETIDINDKSVTIEKSINQLCSYIIGKKTSFNEICKLIISEMKKNICLVCCVKAAKIDNPITIPCGCVFCSYKHLESFFRDHHPIIKDKPFRCYCSYEYDIKDLYNLGLLFPNKTYLKINLRKNVIERLNYIFEKKCCKCLNEDVFERKIKYKDSEEKEKKILTGYKELKHRFCKACVEKIKDKESFICQICDKEHIFLYRK